MNDVEGKEIEGLDEGWDVPTKWYPILYPKPSASFI